MVDKTKIEFQGKTYYITKEQEEEIKRLFLTDYTEEKILNCSGCGKKQNRIGLCEKCLSKIKGCTRIVKHG